MSGDYRDSHAHKGLDYDATLVSTPLDAYMARWEAHWLAQVVRERLELWPHGLNGPAAERRAEQFAQPEVVGTFEA